MFLRSARALAKSSFTSKFLLIAIMGLGFFLRTLNVNWDFNQHLHPDERFLTMVMGDMEVPDRFLDYLNPDVSTLNPVNVGHEFYVYGPFPVVINKVFAIALGNDDYGNLTLQGRWLSAIMDTLSIGAIFLIVRQFQRRYGIPRGVKFFAAFFYAILVFPIQQSHFFTVDTFATTFFLLSVLFSLNADEKKFLLYGGLSGALFGLAVSSKINLLLAGPIVGWFLAEPFFRVLQKRKKIAVTLLWLGAVSILWFVCFWIVLRLTGPYYFAKFSLIDWHLNKAFVKNIQTLKNLSDPNGYFPPSVQWMSKTPIVFPLVNIALYGLGLPLFFFAMFGVGKMMLFAITSWKTKYGIFLLILWITAFFVYQGAQFVSTMRYFLLLYPFLAVFAAFGMMEIGGSSSHKVKLHKKYHGVLVFVSCLICSVWTFMYMSIYVRQNSRVEASFWMYQEFPDKSVIALEHWDDPLPLQVENGNPAQKSFDGKQLPVFYQDDTKKWKEMSDILTEADYYVLTSNRGWGSIMAAPDKYPKMSQFYKELFDEKTEFTKIAEFSSYPSLQYLGIPITVNDDWSEEAFTVYDHPKVLIYAKRK